MLGIFNIVTIIEHPMWNKRKRAFVSLCLIWFLADILWHSNFFWDIFMVSIGGLNVPC